MSREETHVPSRFSLLSPGGAAIFALLLFDAAEAQQRATDTIQAQRITLAEAMQRFETNNLELRLAREELSAARARVITAGAVPNPGLSVNREQLTGGGRSYSETVVSLAHAFEIGGQRGARREAATQGVDAAEARLAAARLRLAFGVHQAYARAALAEANLAALSEATAIFREVERSGNARFAQGDISRFDRNRLQLERLRYENLLAATRLTLEESGRELASLVAPDSLGAPGFRLLPAEPLTALPSVDNPVELGAALLAAAAQVEVRAAEAEIAAARAGVELQRRERTPDLTVLGGYKHQADGPQGAVIGVSFPLPLLDRNSGAIAEAQAELEQAVARRALLLRRTENEVRRAWESYRSLRERVEVTSRTLLPESVGLLETARVAYAEGEMTLLELLDAADTYRAARETVNQLLADHLIAAYDLERATGRLLTNGPTTTASPR